MRATLNLGHTFGHAIETATGYGTFLHGEAVSIGMVMAADMSVRLVSGAAASILGAGGGEGDGQHVGLSIYRGRGSLLSDSIYRGGQSLLSEGIMCIVCFSTCMHLT